MKITAFIIGLVALAVAGAWAAPKAVELGTPTALASDCTPTEDGWQRYSWTGGPHESDDPPAFPSEDWQANVAGDPHGIGVEGAYFVSHGNSGNGDWFYLELVPGHECPPIDTTTGGTTTGHECPPPSSWNDEAQSCDYCPLMEGAQDASLYYAGYLEGDPACEPCPEGEGDNGNGGCSPPEPPCEETLAGQMLGCGDPPTIPPGDVCKNLGGVQTTVPIGYVKGSDGKCEPKTDDPPKRDDPPGTVVGDCVVQTNRELLCGEQG